MLRCLIVIAAILFVSVAVTVQPCLALSFSGHSDGYVRHGRPVKCSKNETAVYKHDVLDIEAARYPAEDGLFALRESRNSYQEAPVTDVVKIGASDSVYSSDRAICIREKIKFPDDGRRTFIRKISLDGNCESIIEWEYKILSDGCARLTRRINRGAGINVYDGEPIESADILSAFELSPIVKETKEICSKLKITADELSSDIDFSDFKLTDERIGDKTVESGASLDFNLSASAAGDSVEFIWRLTVLKLMPDRKEVEFTSCGTSFGRISVSYDGKNNFGYMSEPGKYIAVIDSLMKTEKGYASMPQFKKEIEICAYPRLCVYDQSGSIVADSRFSKYIPPSRQTEELCSGYVYPQLPKSYGYALNRIYMKKGSVGELFKIKLYSDRDSAAPDVSVASEIRAPISIQIKKSGKNIYEGSILATSDKNAGSGCLLTGPETDGRKTFAYFDVTYPEDSECFADILRQQGWISRGEFNSEESELPDKESFFRDFLRSGGMERLVFSASSGQKAVLQMKNQAYLFYYSGHGWGDGTIYTGKGYFNPDEYMMKGDWNDGMAAAVFSSCSVFDIMNFHNRKFTDMGQIHVSPGELWENAAGPDVALLGYNWSTFSGKPPNAFDTRVVRAFLSGMLRGDSLVSAWMNANMAHGEHVAQCAIYHQYYYYLSGGRIVAVPKSDWSGRE